MKDSLTTWLLGGALAASLAWNLRPARVAVTPDSCGNCTSSTSDCSAAIDALDLTPEQRSALAQCCTSSCKDSEQAETRANELANELFTMLARTDADPVRARAAADEIGRLRAQALRGCVDSMLEVRRVLTPEQTSELLSNCCKAK